MSAYPTVKVSTVGGAARPESEVASTSKEYVPTQGGVS
jgi:hypothetical protein